MDNTAHIISQWLGLSTMSATLLPVYHGALDEWALAREQAKSEGYSGFNGVMYKIGDQEKIFVYADEKKYMPPPSYTAPPPTSYTHTSTTYTPPVAAAPLPSREDPANIIGNRSNK